MKRKIVQLTAILSLLFAGFFGCSGDTDGGEAADADFTGTQFVSTDANTGSITVNVNQTSIPVGGTSGFSVQVTDATGAPVGQIRVACDSERGVAIIEPSTGIELTDSFGTMSGTIGCEVPGSFQFVCRLPIGANKRQFVNILCTGDIPTGFTGFAGSAGGGLGTGGVDVIDDGGVGGIDTDGIRVISVGVNDEGGEDTGSSVDIVQDTDCNDDGTFDDPEPFFDSRAVFKVVNNTSATVRFTSMTYTVANWDGAGSNFSSSSINLVGEAGSSVSAEGGENTFTALFADADSGGKDLFGGTPNTVSVAGIRNVTFRLRGEVLGEAVTVTVRTAISFDNFDRCS